MSEELVPFGRYRGQKISVLLKDKGYLDRCRKNPSLMSRYGRILSQKAKTTTSQRNNSHPDKEYSTLLGHNSRLNKDKDKNFPNKSIVRISPHFIENDPTFLSGNADNLDFAGNIHQSRLSTVYHTKPKIIYPTTILTRFPSSSYEGNTVDTNSSLSASSKSNLNPNTAAYSFESGDSSSNISAFNSFHSSNTSRTLNTPNTTNLSEVNSLVKNKPQNLFLSKNNRQKLFRHLAGLPSLEGELAKIYQNPKYKEYFGDQRFNLDNFYNKTTFNLETSFGFDIALTNTVETQTIVSSCCFSQTYAYEKYIQEETSKLQETLAILENKLKLRQKYERLKNAEIQKYLSAKGDIVFKFRSKYNLTLEEYNQIDFYSRNIIPPEEPNMLSYFENDVLVNVEDISFREEKKKSYNIIMNKNLTKDILDSHLKELNDLIDNAPSFVRCAVSDIKIKEHDIDITIYSHITGEFLWFEKPSFISSFDEHVELETEEKEDNSLFSLLPFSITQDITPSPLSEDIFLKEMDEERKGPMEVHNTYSPTSSNLSSSFHSPKDDEDFDIGSLDNFTDYLMDKLDEIDDFDRIALKKRLLCKPSILDYEVQSRIIREVNWPIEYGYEMPSCNMITSQIYFAKQTYESKIDPEVFKIKELREIFNELHSNYPNYGEVFNIELNYSNERDKAMIRIRNIGLNYLYCDIHPILGDNYSLILKELIEQRRILIEYRSSVGLELDNWKISLIIKDFEVGGVSKAELTKMFNNEEFSVVFLDNLSNLSGLSNLEE